MSTIQSAQHTVADPSDKSPSWQGLAAAIALIVAATAVGFSTYAGHGEYSGSAMLLITLGISGSFFSLLWSRRTLPGTSASTWLSAILLAAIALQFFTIIRWWPVNEDSTESPWEGHTTILYYWLNGIAVLMTLCSLIPLRLPRKMWFPVLLLAHLTLGLCVIHASPAPHIDVWYFHQGAAKTLLAGHDPYDYHQTKFVDINDRSAGSKSVYGKQLEDRDGNLKFGFPYPPVSLLCSVIAQVLGKDTRYAQAFAMTLAGLFIGYSRPGHRAKYAAVLLLFTPITWYLLSCAWTEPIVVVFMAATMFCAARNMRRTLPVALGLFMASKQYVPLITPLTFLLLPDFNWRSSRGWKQWAMLLVPAYIVAAVITLPFAIWNFHEFKVSLLDLQTYAPFRWNAISYLVLAHRLSIMGRHIDPTKWVWLAFASIGPLLVFGAWKARRSPAGFLAAISLVYLIFIALNKQAFCNYYYFVTACLCCAVACIREPQSRLEQRVS